MYMRYPAKTVMIAPVSDASLPDVAQAAILFAIQTAAQQFQKSPTSESIAKPGSGPSTAFNPPR